MNGVGVVPEEPEVRRRRRHSHERLDLLDAEARAGGVRVHRHRPHATDAGIRNDQSTNLVKVEAPIDERHRGHADAEILADREVTVVAGNGAEERQSVHVAPGTGSTRHAMQQCGNDHVVHDRQARVAAGEQLIDRNREQLGEDLAQLDEPVWSAIVAQVSACRIAIVPIARKAEHCVRQVELGGRRLASREVEREVLRAEFGVLRFECCAGFAHSTKLLDGAPVTGPERRRPAPSWDDAAPPKSANRCPLQATQTLGQLAGDGLIMVAGLDDDRAKIVLPSLFRVRSFPLAVVRREDPPPGFRPRRAP